MTGEELREALDAWATANPRPNISTLPSDCACERALSPPHSAGQVADEETLAYFVTSTYSINLKKREKKIRQNTLKNVFDKGLSTVRKDYCSDEEMRYSAMKVAEKFKIDEPLYGGLVSVILVSCNSIRHQPERRFFCVYETPSEPTEEGCFLRPNHADILSSEDVEGDEMLARRAELHNILVREANHQSVFEFANGSLSEYAPQILIDERRSET